MAYRVTFDASHKVKGGGGHTAGFLHHIARDVDERQGVQREHSNANIDPARTLMNRTIMPDGAGGWRAAQSVDEIEARLDARLETVKRKPRKNAVIMRPIVTNLSPEWFAENDPDWKENGLNERSQAAYDAMLLQAVEEFGEENVICASLHLDESLPQWQIAVAPVTSDGRLSQKNWYPHPGALKAMGVRFREAVQRTGIEVNLQPSKRSREHLSSDEFQKKADDLKKHTAGLKEHVKTVNAELNDRGRKLKLREQEIDTRETALSAREDAVSQAEEKAREIAKQQAAAITLAAQQRAQKILDAAEVKAKEQEEKAAERAREAAERATEAAMRSLELREQAVSRDEGSMMGLVSASEKAMTHALAAMPQGDARGKVLNAKLKLQKVETRVQMRQRDRREAVRQGDQSLDQQHQPQQLDPAAEMEAKMGLEWG